MSGQSPTKKARESVEDKEMPGVTEGTQPEFEIDMPPTKKARGSVEDKDLLLEFEKDVDDEFEMKREQARQERMEEMMKLEDNEKIEEKIEEIEPSQPLKKQRVNPSAESAVDVEKVLRKVHMASYCSQDNMSVMMTGP